MKFASTNEPCEPAELRRLEEAVGGPLPSDYAQFLTKHDGGQLEPNEFAVEDYGAGVTSFFRASEVTAEKLTLKDRLPVDSWPIADAEGGNLVLLCRHAGGWSVAFWDHELEREIPLADSFGVFLDQVGPAREPGPSARVVSAWIDPSLLAGERDPER